MSTAVYREISISTRFLKPTCISLYLHCLHDNFATCFALRHPISEFFELANSGVHTKNRIAPRLPRGIPLILAAARIPSSLPGKPGRSEMIPNLRNVHGRQAKGKNCASFE